MGGGWPAKFYLTSQAGGRHDSLSAITNRVSASKETSLEKELHPYLTYYAPTIYIVIPKQYTTAALPKKKFGEWIHPDIVDCCFSMEDWENEVYELSRTVGNISIKIISFELKRGLDFGNLRENFFRAVSNSSWANEGYLVAVNINAEEDFREELSRLSTSFGIGIIQLDLEDADASTIIFPAPPPQLDWETINKLTAMNIDFKEFIAQIQTDSTSKKVHIKEYDTVDNLGRHH